MYMAQVTRGKIRYHLLYAHNPNHRTSVTKKVTVF